MDSLSLRHMSNLGTYSEGHEIPSQTQSAIVVFARLPVPGRVKTRLAAGIGNQAACDFYEKCAASAIQECCRIPGCHVIVQHSSNDDSEAVQRWIATIGTQADITVLPQVPHPDLGVKMYEALRAQLQRPGVNKAVVIGTDIPDLSADILQSTLEALNEETQAVFGPCIDGGYYLIGMTRAFKELFPKDMPWSTSVVLQRTMEAAAAAKIKVANVDTLPLLQDVDTLQDLQTWYKSVTHNSLRDSHSVNAPSASLHAVCVQCDNDTDRADMHAASPHRQALLEFVANLLQNNL